MTKLRIQAVVKPNEQQIEQFIKDGVFDPATQSVEHVIDMECDLNELSINKALKAIKVLINEEGFCSLEIRKETE